MKIKQIEGLQDALDQGGSGSGTYIDKWDYNSNTSDPPESGEIRLNDVPGDATKILIHKTSKNAATWTGRLTDVPDGSYLYFFVDQGNQWQLKVSNINEETNHVEYDIDSWNLVGTISNEDEVSLKIDVAGGGSVENASESVAGVVEEATDAETQDSGNSGTGGTGARLFVSVPKLWSWWTNLLATATAWLTNSHMADMPALSVKGRSANSTGAPGDIAAGSNDTFLRRVSNVLDFGQLTNAMVPVNTIGHNKLVNSTGGQALAKIDGGSGPFVATPVINLYEGLSVVSSTRILTASDDIDNGDHTILIDATSGAVTATLPDPETVENQEFVIKLINATNSGFVDPGTDEIEGSSIDIELDTLWQWVRLKAVEVAASTYAYIKIGGNV